jgi:uncharacterized protein YndB with AHSA1/START domain
MVKLSKIFNVSVGDVWAALTEMERMEKWYFTVPNFVLEEGHVFSFDAGGILHGCQIIELKPNEILAYTWTHPENSQGTSVVRWALESLGATKTKLSLTHSGLESFADAGDLFKEENYEWGWNGFVGISLRNYLYGIEKIQFEKSLPASAEAVWEALWNRYGDWCLPFGAGMHWKGDLRAGGRVHLLDENENGFYSDVMEFKEGKKITFSHIGEVVGGEEMPLDGESETWTGCMESFHLKQDDQGTLLVVSVDCTPDSITHMKEVYPKALEQLKNIVV